jgi:hypothetical protein
MTAADVIKSWSDQLKNGGRMLGLATATQAGNPTVPSAAIAAFAEFAMSYRAVDGALHDPEVVQLFSDRQEKESDDSINQPFDVDQADSSSSDLTLQGQWIIFSHTWGTTDTIELSDLGNGVLGGWDSSIGNNAVPSFWTITLSGQVQ